MNKLTLGWMPDGTGSVAPFRDLFGLSKNVMREGIEGIDALILWGGEDIASSYYNERPHPRTDSGTASKRDINEYKAMLYAQYNNIPIIGICRGAQFLCVVSGGKLIQHVVGHHQSHDVTTSDGRKMETSSCHHQMMYPFDIDHEMLAWSTDPESTLYEGESARSLDDMFSRKEPEVVYFPQTRGLAIQGHPEWMDEEDPFVLYCCEMVEKYLLVEQEVAV